MEIGVGKSGRNESTITITQTVNKTICIGFSQNFSPLFTQTTIESTVHTNNCWRMNVFRDEGFLFISQKQIVGFLFSGF